MFLCRFSPGTWTQHCFAYATTPPCAFIQWLQRAHVTTPRKSALPFTRVDCERTTPLSAALTLSFKHWGQNNIAKKLSVKLFSSFFLIWVHLCLFFPRKCYMFLYLFNISIISTIKCSNCLIRMCQQRKLIKKQPCCVFTSILMSTV